MDLDKTYNMDLDLVLDKDLDQAQQYGLRSGPTILIKIRPCNMN